MTTPEVIVFFVFPLAGYLLGSIPFAWVIGKAHSVDIRTTGSKNIGATNLGRTLGAKFFWQAFLLDAAKGFVPVFACTTLILYWHMQDQIGAELASLALRDLSWLIRNQAPAVVEPLVPSWSPLITAAACFLGHLFPLYLKFKGGKGVATSFGVVLGFWPIYTLAGILAGLIFVVVLMIYRYISLASMTGAIAFALLVALLGRWQNPYVNTYLPTRELTPLVCVAAAFAAMIIWRHRPNIGRLLKGTESKIGQREIDKSKMKDPPPMP